jgi:hypothetical protein
LEKNEGGTNIFAPISGGIGLNFAEKKHIWGRNEYSFSRNEWVKKGAESGEDEEVQKRQEKKRSAMARF